MAIEVVRASKNKRVVGPACHEKHNTSQRERERLLLWLIYFEPYFFLQKNGHARYRDYYHVQYKALICTHTRWPAYYVCWRFVSLMPFIFRKFYVKCERVIKVIDILILYADILGYYSLTRDTNAKRRSQSRYVREVYMRSHITWRAAFAGCNAVVIRQPEQASNWFYHGRSMSRYI